MQATETPARDRSAAADSLNRFRAFYFVLFAAESGFVVFRNVYLAEIGLTGYEMGVVGSVMTLGGVVAQPAWGVVTDLFRREKVVLAVGAVGSSVGLLLYPVGDRLASPFLVVAAGTALFSAFRAPIKPIANSVVVSRGLSFGYVRAFGSVAFGVGSLGFGYAVTALGASSTVLFYAVGMGAMTLTLTRLPAFSGTTDGDNAATTLRDVTRLLASRPYLSLLLAAFLAGAVRSGQSSFFSVYMRDVGLGDRLTGIAWTVKTAFEAATFLYAGRLDGSQRTLLVLGVLATGVPSFVYAFSSSAAPVLAAQCVLGVGFALFTLSSVSLAHRTAPASVRSTAQTALTGLGLGVGSAVGQLVAGSLVSAVGVQEMYRYLGTLALAAVVVTALAMRSER